MNVYCIDDGETHWWVSDSENNALREHVQCFFNVALPQDLKDLTEEQKKEVENNLGMSIDEVDVSMWGPERKISIFDADETGKTEEKTASEWAEGAEGTYLLCSTVY